MAIKADALGKIVPCHLCYWQRHVYCGYGEVGYGVPLVVEFMTRRLNMALRLRRRLERWGYRRVSKRRQAMAKLRNLSRPQLERLAESLVLQAGVGGAMLDTFERENGCDLDELYSAIPEVRERAFYRLRRWSTTLRRLRLRLACVVATARNCGPDDVLPDVRDA